VSYTQVAHVHMHAKCEEVIAHLATLLGLLPLPHFEREDTVQLTYTEELPAAKASTGFEIRLSSPHSDRHISPLVESADVSFPVRPKAERIYAHAACQVAHMRLCLQLCSYLTSKAL
jgi:hypothetical protein